MSEAHGTIPGRKFPASTYRVQLHAGFTFAEAARITPYLHALGITHLYTSPILKARSGSMHGYDVVDHSRLNPELGTDRDFDALVAALHQCDMGLIVDIVPNHMGVGTNENAWWNDVLENGPASKFSAHFDINWRDSPRAHLQNKVLLPVLGGPFGEVLERGDLKLVLENDRYAIAYFDRRFPISPASIEGFGTSGRLDPAVFNGIPGKARSFDRLSDLLDAQFYRLAYWRVGPDEINYRRFFDINDLAALRMENPGVFEASHELILKLVDEEKIDGLRIDHPDGLFNPARYFEQLQMGRIGTYVIVEKILAHDERLPEDWPVEGTTGYDFINRINGLFVDSASAELFTQRYQRWTGLTDSFNEICYQKKRLILKVAFSSELAMLSRQLDQLAQRNDNWRDFTLSDIRDALAEVIACFPVYRSYIADRASAVDIAEIDASLRCAADRNPGIDAAVWQFLRSVLLLEYPGQFNDADRAAMRRFVGQFQQLTAPVMAKSVEDTAFYVYNRFVSLNEVGGDPGRFGESPQTLHRWLIDRAKTWPFALSPLSTHDTKRSEDVRARLNVLSELPDEWWACIRRWSRHNEPHRRTVNGSVVPDANDECLIYQTLIGVWPIDAPSRPVDGTFVRRMQDYMLKAAREAKVHTSWTVPNSEYERAIADFLADILSPAESESFLQDFSEMERRVSRLGMLNSLSQTLIRLTAPGVPDIYQGTELWDLSLVDPDNRRPVDYDTRREFLADIIRRFDRTPALARELIAQRDDGRAKLFLTWRALLARRNHPSLFSSGEHLPIEIEGPRREHLFSFLRHEGEQWALIVAPRQMARLHPAGELPLGEEVWPGTHLCLPPSACELTWHDELTGRRFSMGNTIEAAAALADFPAALLGSGPI